MTFSQGQEMTSAFNTHNSSLFQLVSGQRLKYLWKNQQLSLFPVEKPKLTNLTLL